MDAQGEGPATSAGRPRRQSREGAAVAAVYARLVSQLSGPLWPRILTAVAIIALCLGVLATCVSPWMSRITLWSDAALRTHGGTRS